MTLPAFLDGLMTFWNALLTHSRYVACSYEKRSGWHSSVFAGVTASGFASITGRWMVWHVPQMRPLCV